MQFVIILGCQCRYLLLLIVVQAHGSARKDVAALKIEVQIGIRGDVPLGELIALNWLLLVGLVAGG